MFRPRHNFTEKNEDFADLPFVRRVVWPIGTIAIARLQDLKFSEVAIYEKGSQLRGRAFPVDCAWASKA